MPRRRTGGGGVDFFAPLLTRSRLSGQSTDLSDEVFRAGNRMRVDHISDFLAATLQAPDTIKDVSPAGAPTQAQVANSANGEFNSAFDAQSEAQIIGINWNDALLIDATKGAFFQARVKLSAVSAVSRFVFGLASAHNNVLDNITRNAWFRVEGNAFTLFAETDDNTTDNDRQDTGIVLAADTYAILTIDLFDLGDVRFYHNENLVKRLSMPALSGNVQPVLLAQKDSGVLTGGFTVDFYRASWNRE
jgi:hypothetical protein